MLLRSILVIPAAGLLAGCPADPLPVDDFFIELALDRFSAGATCDPVDTCGLYLTPCRIAVGIRILDPPDPDDPGAEPAERNRACERPKLPPASLCDLADPAVFGVRFSFVDPTPGQIEVTIWRDETDPMSPPDCNDPVEFTAAGRPIPTEDNTRLAFGRRVLHDFGGQDPTARVELACTDRTAVAAPECTTETVDLFAKPVNDMADMGDIDPLEASSLSVRIGQPEPDGAGGHFIDPDPIKTPILDLNPDVVPLHWEKRGHEVAEDDLVDGEPVCAIVTEFGSQPVATCSLVTRVTPCLGGTGVSCIEVPGFMLTAELLEDILVAAGLANVPSDGMVIGRVVDPAGQGFPNAVVTAPGSSPTIQYPDDVFTPGTTLTETSSTGFFTARNASFDTVWDATGPGTWRAVETKTGGNLSNRTVTVIVIEMTPDIGP